MDRRKMTRSAAVTWFCAGSLLLLAGCNESGRPLSDGTAGPAYNGQAPVMGVTQGETYVVAAGDTVGTIADRTHTPVRSLIDLNNLQPPYVLQSGTRLRLQPGASVADAGSSGSVGQSMVIPAATPDGSAAPVAADNGGVTKGTLAPLPSAKPVAGAAATAATTTATGAAQQAATGVTTQAATQAPTTLTPKPITTQSMTAAGTTAATAATTTATGAANNAATTATNTATSAVNKTTTLASNQVNNAATGAATAANNATAKAADPAAAIPDFPDASGTASNAAQTATQSAGQTATQVASATPTPPITSTGNGQFGWPVQGKIISKYGATADGLRNDGINIGAPAGAPVVAAADGTVAYAGNELRGFGNMILIRHADGWVTAYAHNQSLTVKKGDAVKRGQTIARVGQTGNVTEPQLHFEIRKGTSAQDPMKYLGS